MSELMQDLERRRLAAAQERRDKFEAERDGIPDIDFSPPDCPICWLETQCVDDGWFTCEGCDLTWPPNGYGHQAERADGSTIAPQA